MYALELWCRLKYIHEEAFVRKCVGDDKASEQRKLILGSSKTVESWSNPLCGHSERLTSRHCWQWDTGTSVNERSTNLSERFITVRDKGSSPALDSHVLLSSTRSDRSYSRRNVKENESHKDGVDMTTLRHMLQTWQRASCELQ